MAMLVGSRTQIGLKDTGSAVTVPNNDVAKLMYYLKCMCSVLDLSSEASLEKITDYTNYQRLTDTDRAALLLLVIALNPIELNDKCIFKVSDTGKDSSNRFLELSSTETTFAASSNVLIGGQKRKVTNIMLYDASWLQNNYLGPLERVAAKIDRPEPKREVTTPQILLRIRMDSSSSEDETEFQPPTVIPPPVTVVQPQRGCHECNRGDFEDHYGCCAIFLCLLFFPIGVFCCLCMNQRKCNNCGHVSG